MNKISLLASVSVLTFLSGCASVTGTTGQSVSVETRQKNGAVLSGASCELTNSKGKWFLNTPGTAAIRRSNDDMIVICNKDGHAPGTAAVVSETKGMMFGNIILGGGIGAIVDHNTGAAYEYPTLIQIMMGSNIKIEPPKSNPETAIIIRTPQPQIRFRISLLPRGQAYPPQVLHHLQVKQFPRRPKDLKN
jgi:hypothetical protein